jgi:hypothetical protein
MISDLPFKYLMGHNAYFPKLYVLLFSVLCFVSFRTIPMQSHQQDPVEDCQGVSTYTRGSMEWAIVVAKCHF